MVQPVVRRQPVGVPSGAFGPFHPSPWCDRLIRPQCVRTGAGRDPWRLLSHILCASDAHPVRHREQFMSTRIYYYIVFSPSRNHYDLCREGLHRSSHLLRSHAIGSAVTAAATEHRLTGLPTGARLDRSGTWEEVCRYGDDAVAPAKLKLLRVGEEQVLLRQPRVGVG